MSKTIEIMEKIENVIGVKDEGMYHTSFSQQGYQIFEKDDISFCVMELDEFKKFDRRTNDLILEYQAKIKELKNENYQLKQKAVKYDTMKSIFKDLMK